MATSFNDLFIRAHGKQAAAETKRIKKNLSEAQRTAAQFGATSKLSMLQLSAGAAAAGVAFGLVARGVSSATREVESFHKALNNVSTLVDERHMPMLEDQIIDLAGALGSATELTEGLYQALSAGVRPAQAVEVVGHAAQFARAGLTDLTSAVDVVTTVLNGYGLAASEAGRVSDILFETVRQGKITGEELAGSLGRVVPAAAVLGVGLDEVGGAMAALTASGLSADEAATSLRATLNTFIKPTKGAAIAAKELGLEFDANLVKTHGLAGALRIVTEATEGDVEKTALLFQNVRALTGELILTANNMEKLTEATDANARANGIAAEGAEKNMRTVSDQSERAWNRFVAVISAGTGFLTEGIANVMDQYLDRLEPVKQATEELGDTFETEFGMMAGAEKILQDLAIAEAEAARKAREHAAAQREFTAALSARLALEQGAFGTALSDAAKQTHAGRTGGLFFGAPSLGDVGIPQAPDDGFLGSTGAVTIDDSAAFDPLAFLSKDRPDMPGEGEGPLAILKRDAEALPPALDPVQEAMAGIQEGAEKTGEAFAAAAAASLFAGTSIKKSMNAFFKAEGQKALGLSLKHVGYGIAALTPIGALEYGPASSQFIAAAKFGAMAGVYGAGTLATGGGGGGGGGGAPGLLPAFQQQAAPSTINLAPGGPGSDPTMLRLANTLDRLEPVSAGSILMMADDQLAGGAATVFGGRDGMAAQTLDFA